MPLNAGRLNRFISITRPAAGKDAAGQPLTTFGPVCTTWADIKAPSGSAAAEHVAANRQVSPATYSMRIRWRTGLLPSMRVTERVEGVDVVYTIAQVLPDVAGREYVDLVCVAGVV